MRRILVVDDDRQIGRAIRAWLGYHGFHVQLANSSAGGLAVLGHAGFDLMIVDVFMPHMRGFGAIRLFHAQAPGVPLIAISGSAFLDPADTAGTDFLKLAARFSATRRLRKPFKPTTLLDVIDECPTQAEPHRRHATTTGSAASAVSEPRSEIRVGN